MKRLLALLLLLPCLAWADNAQVQPFKPELQGTSTISCTASSGATTITAPSSLVGDAQLEIENAGTVTVFIEWGGSTAVAAVASGYPILAGQSKVITVSNRITTVACISGSGTQTVYVTTGRGN